ncbi:autophagy protein 6 [Thoreauomyces humboldtii]|nr:autophagy protein 6 [Thoreauomyces humboldtii]
MAPKAIPQQSATSPLANTLEFETASSHLAKMERWPAQDSYGTPGPTASYSCCSCKQPVTLDSSFLDPEGYNEAARLLQDPRNEHAGRRAGQVRSSGDGLRDGDALAAAVPAEVAALRKERKLAAIKSAIPMQDSFVMLSKPQVSFLHQMQPTMRTGDDDQQRGSLSHRLKTAGKLFNLLAQATDVDHPICEDCADDLMTRLERRVHETRKEKQAYESHLQTLLQEEVDSTRNPVLEETVYQRKEQEQLALQTLKDLKREEVELHAELAGVHAELKELETLKLSYWQEVNEFAEKQYTRSAELKSITLTHEFAVKQLESLQKTNVYNDAFRIWHEGSFGTINGFRLGRLPNQPVDWTEINAALGQSLLLLDTMAIKLRFTFKKYKLVPMGSFSRVDKIDGDKGTHELYGSGDLKGVLFWNRRLDSALVAMLDCLQQIGDYAEQQDPKFRLPYR